MEKLIEEERDYAWRLYAEINGLVELWHYHRELSVEISDKRYETITILVPNFYKRVLVESLSHSIIMGIARVTDKRAKKKTDTNSIYELLKHIPQKEKKSFSDLIKNAEPHFEKIEKWRHKHLAHYGKDFDAKNLILKNSDLKEALNAASEIMNKALEIFSFNNTVLNTDTDITATDEIGKLFDRLIDNK